MDSRLFSERGIWTMIHGIVLGGGALLALAAVSMGFGPAAVFLAFAAGLALGALPSLARS